MISASALTVRRNCAPCSWTADGRVHFNARGADHLWGAYSYAHDSEVRTWSAGPSHRGLGDVSPDGKYALLTVERTAHFGPIGGAWAEPGRGAFNDLWLTDGTKMWQLTGPGTAQSGTAMWWPRFDDAGERVVWAVQYHPRTVTELFGYSRLLVADLVWSDGVPSLQSTRMLEPVAGAFYEPYQFTAEGILCASDANCQGWWDTQIQMVSWDGTSIRRLSPAMHAIPFSTLSYCEFAKQMRDGSVIFCRGWGATRGGMDHWIRRPDGTFAKLTDQSHTTDPADYTLATSFAVNPSETMLYAAYASNAVSAAVDATMYSLRVS